MGHLDPLYAESTESVSYIDNQSNFKIGITGIKSLSDFSYHEAAKCMTKYNKMFDVEHSDRSEC